MLGLFYIATFIIKCLYSVNTISFHRKLVNTAIRSLNGKIVLNLTTQMLRDKLLEYDAVKITTRHGKEVWESKARTYLGNNSELEILTKYNSEIRGLYNYYCIANNSSTINSFYNIMEYSLYKTIASKLNSSIGKVIKKFTHNKNFTIRYEDKKGNIKYRSLYNDGFKRKKFANTAQWSDLLHRVSTRGVSDELAKRMKAQKCEICGSNEQIEVHHVRKLKDLKNTQQWEKKMKTKNRKTLILCYTCHRKLHAGQLD